MKQDLVDLSLVLIGDDGDFVGNGEDHVEILRLEQLRLAILDPFGAGERLALGTATDRHVLYEMR